MLHTGRAVPVFVVFAYRLNGLISDSSFSMESAPLRGPICFNGVTGARFFANWAAHTSPLRPVWTLMVWDIAV